MGGEGGVGGFAYLPAVGEGFQVVQEGVVPMGGVGDGRGGGGWGVRLPASGG